VVQSIVEPVEVLAQKVERVSQEVDNQDPTLTTPLVLELSIGGPPKLNPLRRPCFGKVFNI